MTPRILFTGFMALVGAFCTGAAASTPDVTTISPDLATPPVEQGAPHPGKRVLQALAGYEDSEVRHALYLPNDWEPDRLYPVIAEFTGNNGTVAGGNAAQGYGISGGKGFIWVTLPFASEDGKQDMDWWWGDPDRTADYAQAAIAVICAEWGGDPKAVILTGHSRGAIACNYIGLRNDNIAKLWAGIIPVSHYDNRGWKQSPVEQGRRVERLLRLGSTPQYICGEMHFAQNHSDRRLLDSVREREFVDIEGAQRELDLISILEQEKIREFVTGNHPDGNFTFDTFPWVNHDGDWILRDTPARAKLRKWVGDLLKPDPAVAKHTRAEFFSKSVLPLFETHCFKCHSHETKIKGGLALDSRSGWERGGDSGPAVEPGNLDSSLMFEAVAYVDDDLRMPPKNRLSDAEVAIIRKWIEDGAIDPRESTQVANEGEMVAKNLWSLKPLHVEESGANSIDDFLNASLAEAGLRPNEEADRAALLRRATFGLTGLPPTPEEVEEFLADQRPDAWQRLIDRLLDSPRYGERWARHWLDLARYGDSNGADINYAHANAWRYRDYVIDSFNADKPYDEFIREQLAGDLLAESDPDRRAELLTATGFLALGPKMLAEVDGEKLLIDIVDEQLDVAGKTFLGMTFGCARCHDHKFDPITAKDYYALAGIFRSTKVMDSHRPQRTVGEWVEVDVTPPEERERIDSLRAERKQLQAELAAFGEPVNTKEGAAAAADRAIVAKDLPEQHSTTWAARVRIDTPQSLGTVISADYKGASQGHSLGFDRIKNGQAPRVVWNHNRQTTIITAAEPITLGNWHHLAVTYDADTKHLVLYVDGEPSASAEGVASTPFRKIGVGRREAPKQFQLIGDVDEVVVYNTALTQEEIVVLDAGQNLAHEPVLRWDFEKVEGGEVIDLAGKHNGQLVKLAPETAVIEDGFNRKALTFGSGLALSEADEERMNEIRGRLKVVAEEMPDSIMVMAVQAAEPVDLPIHIRGSHTNPSKEAIRRTTPPVFLPNLPAIEVAAGNSGRVELAKWITHPDNPLTARVMVNRIWRHHFGEGLVSTMSNFGGRGEPPSHPDLLDWLAQEFMDNAWSIKHMHRLITASDAYRRSSDPNPAAAEADADNRLLARYPVRRLEAEAIRDSLLAVSGELELGSPGNLMKSPNMKRVAMTPNDSVYQSRHRGVFLPAIRVRGYQMFSIFDVSDSGQHVAARPQTMVAQQALFFLNNPFVIQRSEQVATQILSGEKNDVEKIEWLHRLMFGSDASPAESELLLAHLQQLRSGASEEAAWQAIAHSLFCSNEFIHLK